MKGFTESGFKTQVKPLADFQEDYGLQADDEDDGHESEEDEEDDGHESEGDEEGDIDADDGVEDVSEED